MSDAKDKSSIAKNWRAGLMDDSPAGDIFSNGAFSVADMICRTGTGSGRCGTVCTGSRTNECC
jgi:hypothetical protein